MRIAWVLPGLHRIVRGAEVAFEAIARQLATYPTVEVTLFGSGEPRGDDPYQFIQVKDVDRRWFESWPRGPIFRNEYVYEEFTFAINFWHHYQPQHFDITITCSYPFINWILRTKGGKNRPRHVFVTQNSDYPAITNRREYRFFGCEGLVCTNQEYFERNQSRWFCELIPNGVDLAVFCPGAGDRAALGLPSEVPLALMVSALTPSKRILAGIEAAAQLENLHLVVCGDGPQRQAILALGNQLMPGRLHLKQLPHAQMPALYRSADLLLHLSLDEPFGNVYLEALATGLPVVTHDRAVTRWILEDTGLFVDSHHAPKIIEGITTALHCPPQAIAARRSLVERRFSWSQIGHAYYQFLESVMARF